MLDLYQDAIAQKKKYGYSTQEWDKKLAEAQKPKTPPKEPLSHSDLLDLIYLLVLERQANPDFLLSFHPELKSIIQSQSTPNIHDLLTDLKGRNQDRPDPLWRRWALAQNETALTKLAEVLHP